MMFSGVCIQTRMLRASSTVTIVMTTDMASAIQALLAT